MADIHSAQNLEPSLRVVVHEILDELPADHPDAIASRNDLYRINVAMGNYRFLKRRLRQHLRSEDHCIEIGAGGGQLASVFSVDDLAQQMTGLDLAPRPSTWPNVWDWEQADIFATSIFAQTDIILASLILHHFTDEQLHELGQHMLTHARVLIVSEPCRATFPHLLGRAAECLGINHVTRHDMHVSINAGFRMGELPLLLGLPSDQWEIEEQQDWRGSLRMVACRN